MTTDKEEIKKEDASSLVKEYLDGATIHGFSQLIRAQNLASRTIWVLSIICTASLLSYMVYYCFQGWEDNPILTAVAQIPIESIWFLPITFCPLYPPSTNESLKLKGTSNISEYVWYCSFRRNGIDEGKVCNRIQIVSSELGYCITFNNVDITLHNSEGPVKVPGAGKNNGLKLLLNPAPNGLPIKYRVFVSEMGTIYSKVYFDVNVKQQGDIIFDIHGLHLVQAGQGFEEWNRDKKVCYFPKQKKLQYFSAYMQANCRLECAWNKTIDLCGCAPGVLALKNIPPCSESAMECWDRTLIQVQNEEEDEKCDCRVDCEMIHFFFSMRKTEAQDVQETESAMLYFLFDTHIISDVTIQLRLTFFDKVASVGGLLGLFSGISVMSVIEILYYFYLLVILLLSKKKASSDRQVTPVMPFNTQNY